MSISSTLNCMDIIKSKKANDYPVYNMGLGENPIKQPKLIIESVKSNATKKHYTSFKGIDKLNQTLSKIYSKDNEKNTNILIGNGLKELLFVIQLAFKGKIFHITPSWVSYYEQISILDKNDNLVQIHTSIKDNYKIIPEKLEKVFNDNPGDKMIIFNNPCNPTGIAYTKTEIKLLSNILKKHKCIVMSDEIYLNLVHDNSSTSIAEYIPELTIRGTSVSKDLACGGYRLGWLVFPNNLKQLYEKCSCIASSIYSCASTPIQYAVSDMLSNYKLCNNYFNKNKNIYKLIVKEVDKLLKTTDLDYIYPNSAWYIFLNFTNYIDKLKNINIKTSDDLASYFIQNLGIICVSGTKFSCNDLSIRLSLVDIDPDIKLQENIDNLDKKYYSNLIDGIKILVKFLNSL